MYAGTSRGAARNPLQMEASSDPALDRADITTNRGCPILAFVASVGTTNRYLLGFRKVRSVRLPFRLRKGGNDARLSNRANFSTPEPVGRSRLSNARAALPLAPVLLESYLNNSFAQHCSTALWSMCKSCYLVENDNQFSTKSSDVFRMPGVKG